MVSFLSLIRICYPTFPKCSSSRKLSNINNTSGGSHYMAAAAPHEGNWYLRRAAERHQPRRNPPTRCTSLRTAGARRMSAPAVNAGTHLILSPIFSASFVPVGPRSAIYFTRKSATAAAQASIPSVGSMKVTPASLSFCAASL